jgi:Domain of unknown function (DUF4157)
MAVNGLAHTIKPASAAILRRKCECDRGQAGREQSAVEPRFNYDFSNIGIHADAKLEVGAIDDPLEREADAIADRVMRFPGRSATAFEPVAMSEGTLQRRYASCEKEDGPHRKAAPGDLLRSPGRELPGPVRRFMEPRLGRVFGDVRVHTDAAAARSARAVSALAYTAGRDVVFGEGQFVPDGVAGRRLIAHELAHVIQQSAGPGRPPELQRQTAKGGDDGDDFSDDPLTADGFGPADQTVRVRPGPVRTTIVRSRLTDIDGYTYDDPRLRHSGRQQVEPGAWIQDLLSFFILDLVIDPGAHPPVPGSKYLFRRAREQRFMTRAQVIDAVVAEGAAEGRVIDPAAVDGAITARLGPERAPEPSTSRVSYSLSVSGVKTGHIDPKTGRGLRADEPGGQLAVQVTWELHEEDKSGPELSWTGQVTGFQDPANVPGSTSAWQVQNVATGPQAAWAFSFLKGSLQVEPILQFLAGFQRGQQTGSTRFQLLPTSQVSAGGQLLLTVPGTSKKLQVGAQATGAYTAPGGAPPTVDYSGTIILQWKF